jgi:hypothetical protein
MTPSSAALSSVAARTNRLSLVHLCSVMDPSASPYGGPFCAAISNSSSILMLSASTRDRSKYRSIVAARPICVRSHSRHTSPDAPARLRPHALHVKLTVSPRSVDA